MYECGRCKKEITLSEMGSLPGIKCSYCGYRILYKVRPPVVKKIKAR
ncbi:MAG: DNA-directed RNA polymerase subunit P [Candidatus Lokiarchaeota archaeon]|nr:DNA-directed RNA polymerase subunit P [Candidatus Lokiarchaeota archaeon]